VSRFITEGSAKIFEEGNVFYNPVQEFNRDISISVLNTFLEIYRKEPEAKNPRKDKQPQKTEGTRKKIRILEALSATGLRSIRYAKEIPGVDEIIANDLSSAAVEMIKRNVVLNEVEKLVTPNKADAM
jgi:tRNA (guanine26-N2/guanine27-N2)-dimethyltransferase